MNSFTLTRKWSIAHSSRGRTSLRLAAAERAPSSYVRDRYMHAQRYCDFNFIGFSTFILSERITHSPIIRNQIQVEARMILNKIKVLKDICIINNKKDNSINSNYRRTINPNELNTKNKIVRDEPFPPSSPACTTATSLSPSLTSDLTVSRIYSRIFPRHKNEKRAATLSNNPNVSMRADYIQRVRVWEKHEFVENEGVLLFNLDCHNIGPHCLVWSWIYDLLGSVPRMVVVNSTSTSKEAAKKLIRRYRAKSKKIIREHVEKRSHKLNASKWYEVYSDSPNLQIGQLQLTTASTSNSQLIHVARSSSVDSEFIALGVYPDSTFNKVRYKDLAIGKLSPDQLSSGNIFQEVHYSSQIPSVTGLPSSRSVKKDITQDVTVSVSQDTIVRIIGSSRFKMLFHQVYTPLELPAKVTPNDKSMVALLLAFRTKRGQVALRKLLHSGMQTASLSDDDMVFLTNTVNEFFHNIGFQALTIGTAVGEEGDGYASLHNELLQLNSGFTAQRRHRWSSIVRDAYSGARNHIERFREIYARSKGVHGDVLDTTLNKDYTISDMEYPQVKAETGVTLVARLPARFTSNIEESKLESDKVENDEDALHSSNNLVKQVKKGSTVIVGYAEDKWENIHGKEVPFQRQNLTNNNSLVHITDVNIFPSYADQHTSSPSPQNSSSSSSDDEDFEEQQSSLSSSSAANSPHSDFHSHHGQSAHSDPVSSSPTVSPPLSPHAEHSPPLSLQYAPPVSESQPLQGQRTSTIEDHNPSPPQVISSSPEGQNGVYPSQTTTHSNEESPGNSQGLQSITRPHSPRSLDSPRVSIIDSEHIQQSHYSRRCSSDSGGSDTADSQHSRANSDPFLPNSEITVHPVEENGRPRSRNQGELQNVPPDNQIYSSASNLTPQQQNSSYSFSNHGSPPNSQFETESKTQGMPAYLHLFQHFLDPRSPSTSPQSSLNLSPPPEHVQELVHQEDSSDSGNPPHLDSRNSQHSGRAYSEDFGVSSSSSSRSNRSSSNSTAPAIDEQGCQPDNLQQQRPSTNDRTSFTDLPGISDRVPSSEYFDSHHSDDVFFTNAVIEANRGHIPSVLVSGNITTYTTRDTREQFPPSTNVEPGCVQEDSASEQQEQEHSPNDGSSSPASLDIPCRSPSLEQFNSDISSHSSDNAATIDSADHESATAVLVSGTSLDQPDSTAETRQQLPQTKPSFKCVDVSSDGR